MPPSNDCIHVTHEQSVALGKGTWSYQQCIICKQIINHEFYDETNSLRTLKDMLDDGKI